MTTTQSVTTTSEAATTTTEALVPMSAAGIGQWKTDAIAFADRFGEAFPDAGAQCAQFADDVAFYDPADGDFVIAGKQSIVQMQQAFNDYGAELKVKVHRDALYLSGDSAAYTYAMENMWPPWAPEPADHPPTNDLEVFRFKDGLVTNWDIWFSAPTLEMIAFGVFAPDKGGSEQLQEIVDRYLEAWASGDKAQIAALYHPDAVFSDTMLGLQAQGPAAISELGTSRFGSPSTVTFEVVDLYAQTNSYTPPTDEIPGNGVIIGVGIHYLATLSVEGASKTVEGLTTFELGTRQGKSFSPDPNGLITREEVFYDADSLLASGLVD